MSAAHIKASPCSCVCAVWTHMTEWPRFTRLRVLKVTSLSTLLCFGLICTSHFPKAGSRDYIFIAFPVLASFIRIPSVKWWHLFIYFCLSTVTCPFGVAGVFEVKGLSRRGPTVCQGMLMENKKTLSVYQKPKKGSWMWMIWCFNLHYIHITFLFLNTIGGDPYPHCSFHPWL